MKSIFPAAINGNLLNLVHLSNDFRMVDGAKPLAVGDVCKAKALIISVINAKEKSSRLRALFIIKANASSKSCRHSCNMDVFWIMRTPSIPLIMLFLSSQTRTLAAVLQFKEWFEQENESSSPLAGTSLIFRIQSQVSFKDRTAYRLGLGRYLHQESAESSHQSWLHRFPARRFAGQSCFVVSSMTWYPAWSHHSSRQ